MNAWPFFISSHRVQGFTVIVAPDFMCQDESAKLLASYAGGEPGDRKHHEIPKVEGKTKDILTLTYRIEVARGPIVGEDVDILRDAVGRSIPIIEGVVTKGKDKNITIAEKDFGAIREICQPAFKNLWQSSVIIPTQPSNPITLSDPFASACSLERIASNLLNRTSIQKNIPIILVGLLIFIGVIFLISFLRI